MQSKQICETAAALVSGDRATAYGDMGRTHANIATLWNAYLAIRQNPAGRITSQDVAHMMILLKLARTQGGALNIDDYIDMAGYAGCAGEMASDG